MATLYKRNQEVLANKMDNELILLSLKQNRYFGFNEVGTRIWELLEHPLSTEEIIKILLEEYEIDEEVCRKEVETFIEDMLDKKLIATVKS